MKLLLAFVLTFGLTSASMSDYIMETVKITLLSEECWGKEANDNYYKSVTGSIDKCEQEQPLYTSNELFPEGPNELQRAARQQSSSRGRFSGNNRRFQTANNIDPDALQKVVQFTNKMEEMKEAKTMMISNWTCVMRSLKYWDENNNIDIDFYSRGMWNGIDMEADLKDKMIEGFKKCYTYSEAIPVDELFDKKPMVYKMFFRQKKFNKCALKKMTQTCANKVMARLFEEKYGPYTPAIGEQLGLPPNKYEAAYLAMKVTAFAQSDTKKYILKYLYHSDA